MNNLQDVLRDLTISMWMITGTLPYQKSKAARKTQQKNCIISSTSDSILISLGIIDRKILAIYCLKTFVNNFSFINPKNIKILRLDASGYDESNEP